MNKLKVFDERKLESASNARFCLTSLPESVAGTGGILCYSTGVSVASVALLSGGVRNTRKVSLIDHANGAFLSTGSWF